MLCRTCFVLSNNQSAVHSVVQQYGCLNVTHGICCMAMKMMWLSDQRPISNYLSSVVYPFILLMDEKGKQCLKVQYTIV